MSWIPGWDSIAAATWWSSFYFWAGIVALLALGISEVISHRYSERKDELVSEQQAAADRAHAEEIARLHLATAQADARSAEAQRETERLKADNLAMQAGLRPRRIAMLSGEARVDKFKEVAKYADMVALIQSVPGDFEAATLAGDISNALGDFGWKPSILSEAEWLVSPRLIMEGVHIVTIEESPFADGLLKPDPPAISDAGRAAQVLVTMLNWDLGPPHGPPFFGAYWAPEWDDPSFLFRGMPVPAKGVVIVLVGMRPLTFSLPPFATQQRDPTKP